MLTTTFLYNNDVVTPVFHNTSFFSLIVIKSRITELENLQSIKSDPTLRKIMSDALGHLDKHKKELWDLILTRRAEEHGEYVQEVSSFSVHKIK